MAERPLSPHLSIWKWGPNMAVSILHRITGDGMAFVALPVMLWWLGALMGGPETYATFTGWMWADLGHLDWSGALVSSLVKLVLKIVTVGISWAFFNHMCSGLRHFVMDLGAGYEVHINRRWSIASMLIAIALTIAFWAVILH